MMETAEVWLFGSTARGDTDELSDVDVLVAGSLDPSVLQSLDLPQGRLSIVRYEWPELRHMAAYGSLFLHHVRLEGRPLQPAGGPALTDLLSRLPAYERAERELHSFEAVLADVESAVAGDHSPPFELAVIATTMRHACILGCYAIGQPTFGRRAAFSVFLRHVDRGSLVESANRLYHFRLFEDGRSAIPYRPTTRDVMQWLRITSRVIEEVQFAIDNVN
jgi:hypothetical protein